MNKSKVKLTKKQKRDKIFNNFIEENFPIAYKINKLNYEVKRR